MKKHFAGFFPPSELEIAKLWEACFFAFDTSTLLDLYRFSPETQKEWLSILRKLGELDRVWIPHQVGKEFSINRLDVIADQRKKYAKALETVNELPKVFEDKLRHPFLGPSTLEKLEKLISEVAKEVIDRKGQIVYSPQKDSILEAIFTIFDGKIGDEYSVDDLNKIIREGEDRYKNFVAPGYADQAEKEKESKNELDRGERANALRKYGDLIIWKQLIDEVKTRQRPAILVTSERKKDWWMLYDNDKRKPVGPRPELFAEMKEKTKQQFSLYALTDFMTQVGTRLKQEVSQESIKEVRAVEQGKATESAWVEVLDDTPLGESGPTPKLIFFYKKVRGTIRRFANDLEQARLNPPFFDRERQEQKAMIANYGKTFVELGKTLVMHGVESARFIITSGREIQLAAEESFPLMVLSTQEALTNLKAALDIVRQHLSKQYPGWSN